jgi:hypothetical protein
MVRVSPTGNPQEVPKPAAYSFREIRLHEDVNNDAFERFMIGELFPTIDTSDNGFGRDQHTSFFRMIGTVTFMFGEQIRIFRTPNPFPGLTL